MGGSGGSDLLITVCHSRTTAHQLSAILVAYQDLEPKLSPSCLRP